MLKLTIFAIVIALATANPGLFDGAGGVVNGFANTAGGIVNGVANTAGGFVNGVANGAVGIVEGFFGSGNKLSFIPWFDLAPYFEATHGIKRITLDSCTCPYVLQPGYPGNIVSGQDGNIISNILGTVTNTGGQFFNGAVGTIGNIAGSVTKPFAGFLNA